MDYPPQRPAIFRSPRRKGKFIGSDYATIRRHELHVWKKLEYFAVAIVHIELAPHRADTLRRSRGGDDISIHPVIRAAPRRQFQYIATTLLRPWRKL
jgi:hypothetical protein